MTKTAYVLLAAAMIGCAIVPNETTFEDEGRVGTTTSALFAPFVDDFNTPWTPQTKWGTFEEVVNQNPCYGQGIASVTQVSSPRRPPGKTGGALAVIANATSSTKSNHVLAQKFLSTDGVDVRLDYETWAMIDPSAGDGFHEGQTGPEISIQRTKLLPEGWRTMTGGVQYVANKWDRIGEWHLWTDAGGGNAGWVTIRTGSVLTPGVWYKITLRLDYATKTYRSLSVAGTGANFTIDLTGRVIVKETKFSQDALGLTLESENAWSTCSTPFQYTVFYDDVSLTASGKPCDGPDTQACGNCGTASRVCNNGKWGPWGSCTNEGVCAAASTRACGSGGTQTCDATCNWGVCVGSSQCSGGGTCTPGATQACGSGGTQTCDSTCNWSVCVGQGGGGCTPKTCSDIGANCGSTGDGCGGIIQCGTCAPPQICGGGGVAYQCGAGGSCTPSTCGPGSCGLVSDGCGGLLSCGACTYPQICGGGGPNVCGVATSCTPRSCEDAGAECGSISDGCGGTRACGDCLSPGATCGGGGVPNKCGFPTCTPMSCESQGKNCGFIGDGCGNVLDCGQCGPGTVCGAGGVANVCSAP